MAVNNTTWSDSTAPANASYTDEIITRSTYAETTPATAVWSRTSGIDTAIALYDDTTITYDDTAIYYDDYDASIITADDVKFDSWSDSGTPANAAWTDTS